MSVSLYDSLNSGGLSLDPTTNSGSMYYNPNTGGIESYDGTSWSPIPNTPNSTGLQDTRSTSTTGGTTPYSQTQAGADDRAYLDDQEGILRRLLQSSQSTLNNGLTQLDDSFNTENQRAGQQRDSAMQGYATQRQRTTEDKQGAIEKIDTGARTGLNSLQRILAQAGGTGSSAYKEAAPYVVSRDASIKRTDANQTYGRNFQNIDTAESQTKTAFEQMLEDLAKQRKERESGLREGVAQQEQNTYRDLSEVARQRALLDGGGYTQVKQAMAPYTTEINNRQSTLDNLFSQFRTPFTPKAVAPAQAELGQYTVDKSAIAAQQQGGGSQYSPYANFLKKRTETV